MPTVPTYIKSSDLATYLAIKGEGKGAWSEFIHNVLNSSDLPSYSPSDLPSIPTSKPVTVKADKVIKPKPSVPKPKPDTGIGIATKPSPTVKYTTNWGA